MADPEYSMLVRRRKITGTDSTHIILVIFFYEEELNTYKTSTRKKKRGAVAHASLKSSTPEQQVFGIYANIHV